MIALYTDGSVQKNGKPEGYAGWSMISDQPGKLYVRYGHMKPTSTNGRGEIGGVLYGLSVFWNTKLDLTFISDAQYVVRSVNDWRHKHKSNGYQGIKNQDLLEPLYNLWDYHGRSSIQWVKGHSGVRGNEIADEWADKGCRQIVRDRRDDKVDIRFISDAEFNETVNKAYSDMKSLSARNASSIDTSLL